MTTFNNSKTRRRRALRRSATLMGVAATAATLLACGGGGSAGADEALDGKASALSARRDADETADRKASRLLAKMTQAEKIQLVHGAGPRVPGTGGGLISGIERLGIPDIKTADAASGVNVVGVNATPLPNTLAMAASWDTDLAASYGTLIAKELRTLGFAQGLGGGLNLAREPRNGRTFEYLGEDPVLAGLLMAARTEATQSQKVIATLKHYAANNQETNRFGTPDNNFLTSNSIIDERTLRELYLLGFEIATVKSQPGNVMCAYNAVNNEKACENKKLLTDILKDEWGFKGVVQSDWIMALTDTARAANAGTDEEQPGNLDDYNPPPYAPFPSYFNQKLKAALDAGTVAASRLDDMVRRKLRTLYRIGLMDSPPPKTAGTIDTAAGDALALQAAERSMVLLKNAMPAGDISTALPLDPTRIRTVVVIGGHADAGVISGGGSGSVPSRTGAVDSELCLTPGARDPSGFFPACAIWYRSSPVDALKAALPGVTVTYLDGSNQAAAVAAAAAADAAIVVGTQFESEQFDLHNLSLPDNAADPANQAYDQNALIAAVGASAKRTVVVLETGTAVTMPWLNSVHAVVQAWYPGTQGGQAIANILVGAVNPSGKLPLSFPVREGDLPQATISATDPNVVYSEGLKMGYRWYDAKSIQPLFPFGHGLSYTTFGYSGLHASIDRHGEASVSFWLRNTGSRSGAEVAQVYAALPVAAGEPPQRLVGWKKVKLAAGESRHIKLTIPAARFAVWDKAWKVPAGSASIRVGGSSRDQNALSQSVELRSRTVAHAE
jgi:beta-glucosidase